MFQKSKLTSIYHFDTLDQRAPQCYISHITLWPCGQGYIMILPGIHQDISLTTIYTRLIALMQANSLLSWGAG